MPPPPPPPPSNVPPPVAYKPPPEVSTAGRGDLLDSIRKGNKLKKVPESEKKEKSGDIVGQVVDRNAPKKPSSGTSTPKPANTGFVSTGNPMMDEILKKRQGLGNSTGGSSSNAHTPPTRATPPTVPSNRPPSSSTVPNRTAPPTLPSRSGSSQTTSTPPPVVSTPSVPTRTTPSLPTRTTPSVPTSSNTPPGETGRRAPPPLPQKSGDASGRRAPPPLPQKSGGISQPSLPSRNPPPTASTSPPVVSTPPTVVEKKPPPPPRNEVKKEESSPTLPVRKQPPSTPPVLESTQNESNIQTEGRFQFRTDLPPVPPFTGKPKIYKTRGAGSNTTTSTSQTNAPSVPPPRPTKPKRDIEKEKTELEAQANTLMQEFVKKMMFEKCVPLRDLLEKIKNANDEATIDTLKEQLLNM